MISISKPILPSSIQNLLQSVRKFQKAWLGLSCGLIVSCSGNKNADQEPKVENTSFEHRVQSTKWDPTRRSSFERTAKTVKTDKEFRTGAAFRTNEYRSSGLKQFYSGKKEMSQKSFQQSGRTAKVAGEAYRDSNRQSRQAGETFNTNSSRFDNQKSRYSNSSFRESGHTFRTRDEPIASKAMSDYNRPYIEKFDNPSYSEADIKSILSKEY